MSGVSWEPEAFTCSQCDAVLYSLHLLDLHLLELHDAFFEAQVMHAQQSYPCQLGHPCGPKHPAFASTG